MHNLFYFFCVRDVIFVSTFSEIKVENQNSLLSQAECNTPLARFSSIILREEVGIFTHFGFLNNYPILKRKINKKL